jgi:hypothetical protein
MAGGKETPRQKMIGMMYLVLTALLALNVSKQVLEAFAAIEDNTQRSNENLYLKGQESKSTLINEVQTLNEPKDQAKKEKVKTYLSIISKLDFEVGKMIQFIDDIKFQLLTDAGEEFDKNNPKPKDRNFIVWSKFNPQEPVKPIRFNLFKVEHKDDFDVPMNLLVGSDIGKITSPKGMELWNNFKKLRKSMVEIAGTYDEGIGQDGVEKKWNVKVGDINKFTDSKDLQNQLQKMLKASGNKLNPDDLSTLKLVYELMSKNEFDEYGEDKANIHWLGRTFDHAPLVGALASLSSLQNDVLQAREKLIALLKRKVSTGDFSFNQIEAFVAGDAVVTSGQELNIKVTMAAYDTDKNPKVVISGVGTQETGKGIVNVKRKVTGNGEQTISGTVTILGKSYEEYTRNWEHKYVIIDPQGSLALPEMQTLYADHENIIVPSASGYINARPSSTQGTLVKRPYGTFKEAWVLKLPKGAKGKVTITLWGKTKDLKEVNVRSDVYNVKNFPKAQISNVSKKISKSKGGLVVVNLGEGFPITSLKFAVVSWILYVNGEPVSGNGSIISSAVLKKAKVGSKVFLVVSYKKIGSMSIDETETSYTVIP